MLTFNGNSKKTMNRRTFLTVSAQLAAGMVIPSSLLAMPPTPRPLRFYHAHTGEKLSIEYSPETYTASVQRSIEHFLRDFRTNEVHAIDRGLLDVLATIQYHWGNNSFYEVLSGYRSPKTNEFLRRKTRGVAKKSYHLQGKAIDIRLAGVATKNLRDLAVKYNNGGVGFYPKSDFIHIDTGEKRTW